MDIATASMILSCTTNTQLAALHDFFELEVEEVKNTGRKATIYYKNETNIKSLSLPLELLQPSGKSR
jgi:hypothetical protein